MTRLHQVLPAVLVIVVFYVQACHHPTGSNLYDIRKLYDQIPEGTMVVIW